ncbi:hypothetical protein [Heliophilum fasciatum]|uniref:Lipoprotein n=1 Tax=Heliophilum fasciatum TaxID=35700 RepID=A0A4R2RJL5_9FIRM|nr:hypothetical protein [Heliophilum fasciatum]MCW2279007.1 hypothetical protein [Heliophilum fasciatum]TCP64042.1 hypothetical protein EDD73_1123 [Heliophilum fasciatum]
MNRYYKTTTMIAVSIMLISSLVGCSSAKQQPAQDPSMKEIGSVTIPRTEQEQLSENNPNVGGAVPGNAILNVQEIRERQQMYPVGPYEVTLSSYDANTMTTNLELRNNTDKALSKVVLRVRSTAGQPVFKTKETTVAISSNGQEAQLGSLASKRGRILQVVGVPKESLLLTASEGQSPQLQIFPQP